MLDDKTNTFKIALFVIILIIFIVVMVMKRDVLKLKKTKDKMSVQNIEIEERPEELQKYISNFKLKTPYQLNKFQFYNGDENITEKIMTDNIKPVITKSINTNPSKNVIDNVLKPSHFTEEDVKVLQNKGYLKNFYYDMYGNRVEASLKDYFVNYDTTIDDADDSKCVKVNISKKNSGFIIPNQYPTLKYQTNAYNVDWSRIINPLTYY